MTQAKIAALPDVKPDLKTGNSALDPTIDAASTGTPNILSGYVSTFLSSFAPLRERNFRIYIGGQAVSQIGTWLQATAQGWLVWKLTGSESALGTVAMLNTLPTLVLSPWAGVWADRLDRRKLLIWTQVGAMLLAFMLAWLVQSNQVQIWHVYVMSLCLGIINTVDLPAQQAFLGDLSGMGAVRKAVNMNAMILQVSRMIGPALAGWLVARVTEGPAFLLNGLSFLAVIVSLVAVRATQTRRIAANTSPLRQIGDAAKYLRTQPRLQDLFFFATLMACFVWSVLLSLLPSVSEKLLGGNIETLGTLQSASGAGALVSVLLIVPQAQAARRIGWVLGVAAVLVGASLFVFGMSRSLPLSIAAIFAGSMMLPVIFTMALGLTQVMSPPEMRARMLSLFIMIAWGLQPLASLACGWLAQHIGVATTIEINGLIIIVASVVWLSIRRGLREWVYTPPASPLTVQHIIE